MEHLWKNQQQRKSGRHESLVGCIPILRTPQNTAPLAESPPRSGSVSDEGPVDAQQLNSWGVSARVLNLVRNNAAEAKASGVKYIVTLEGVSRFKIDHFVKSTPFIEAVVTLHGEQEGLELDIDKEDAELQAAVINLRATGHELANVLSQLQLPTGVLGQLRRMLDNTPPGQVADLLASMIDLSFAEKLQILELADVKARVMRVTELINRQIQVLKISQKLQTTVENKLGKKQREFLLRQQMEAIKKELGESDESEQDEVGDLTKRIEEAKLPDDAAKAAAREIRRLKKLPASVPEYQVVRNYLEWLSELPWSKHSDDVMDIARAREQLNEDHSGLDKVKTRIVEYLAVRKLNQDLKGPILCFLGPPGVGKTSLGRSIANALGRKFHRISLGGVRDEAEIRGHRRTYVGAMPGTIIQAMRKCGVNNPVILLDEIDKLGRDVRGDPSSALLEVLDPEQNSTFTDHYMNVPFDLSKVLFIATANEADTIPGPLYDRMEVIQIPGYTFDEKLHIAKRHLLPKQIKSHGLDPAIVSFDDSALNKIATGYTREAGVRNLEREIGALCRSLAVEYADAKEKAQTDDFRGAVDVERVRKVLGPERFDDEVSERTSIPGVITGLAWTASGSGGLLFIEATQMPGNGVLHLTGKLGDVIKESGRLALTWVRSNAVKLGISKEGTGNVLAAADVHIHIPAGATPKDGPSAGVTIVTALVSLFTSRTALPHTAMTGEITLRGQVLPVGGIKEKVLAAHRGGIKRVILPFRNQKDLVDVPANVRQDIEFITVKTVWEVLDAAFGAGWRETRNVGEGDEAAVVEPSN
ncbi:hypothetical protein HK104_002962, partial [Borealophlyctis nickersoniae]